MSSDSLFTFSCKITSGEYAKIVFARFFGAYWILFAFPLLVCGCLSVLDIRVFIIALMLVFVVIPLVMFFLYSYYMFTDSMVWSISDKQVTLTPGGHLVLDFENPKLSRVVLKREEIKTVERTKTYVLLQCEDSPYRVLVIPVSAFADEGEAERFVGLLVQ
ncbi:MAG: hypothetical protein Q4B68_04845 [Bacteroidales bacterium]|nr:hypothetical protein [Bacteroidales bacterium]